MINVITNLLAVFVTYLFVAWVNDFNELRMLVAFALIIMYHLLLITDRIEELKK